MAWIVGAVNCSATPDNVACVLDDVGNGLGDLFSEIAVPLGTLIIVLGVAGAIGAILYGVGKLISKAR